MSRVVEKLCLYVQHLKGTIPTIKSSNDRATVKGKLSLSRSNVIKMLNAVQMTKFNDQPLLAKLKKHPHFIFKLPKLKLVIDTVSSGEDEEPLYQGHKLMNYSREKRYLEDHAAYIVQTVIDCFQRRYGNLFGGEGREV